MSLVAALFVLSQSASPVAVQAPRVSTAPVAERVRATVRVLRPQRIEFLPAEEVEEDTDLRGANVQRGRDDAGTIWVEFS